MHWFNQIEKHKTLIVTALYLIAIATLIVSSLRVFVGHDVFWHLQMGKDLIENALSPWVDHYSFTYDGAEITSPPVVFQLLLYSLASLFGDFNGFFAIRLVAFLLTMAMMFVWLRQIQAPALAHFLVIPMLPFLLQLRAIVRPELFSYPLIIIALILYQRARLQLSIKSMLPILVLLLVWVNLHSSIFGYVIFFGLFLDIAIRLFKERAPFTNWVILGLWGGLFLGVGFLNPDSTHPVLQYVFFPSEWKASILEYKAPLQILPSPATWILIAVTFVTLVLLAKQRKLGFFVVGIIFVYAGMTMGRIVTPAGIIILCLFAHVLSDQRLISAVTASPKLITWSLGILCSLSVVTLVSVGVVSARGYMRENFKPFTWFPYELTEHMIKSGKHGRIFNVYGLGGYLIYRLHGESQVYIDGRTEILYPVSHFQRQIDASTYSSSFLEEVEKYDIDYAILEASESRAALMAESGFNLEFVDIQFALWSREDAALATSGMLWAKPYCWSRISVSSLEAELAWAEEALPRSAPILPLMRLAKEYVNSPEPSDFFSHYLGDEKLSDSARRFIGFRAIESGLFETAARQFQQIIVKQPKDYLAGGLALLRLGDVDNAEVVLDLSTRTQWIRLDTMDILMQWALLREIADARPLRLFDEQYIRNLDDEVAKLSQPHPVSPVSISSFCLE